MLRPDFGDGDILDYFQQRTSTREGIQEFLKAARRVREGVIFANSIDTFIDTHRGKRWVRFPRQFGGWAKVDSESDYAANFSCSLSIA
jgi:hypothetical protein